VGIVTWGTRPEQRVVTAPLSQIAQEVEKANLKPPAIIIMGGVVSLREKLRWFDNHPLFGKKIVVTRTREQASKLTGKLIAMGARVIEFPTIEIKREDDMSGLHKSFGMLNDYNWIVFTSQNAVNIFFDELYACGRDVRALGSIRIAVIGRASGDELKQYGIIPDLVPEKFVAESLLEEMAKHGMKGKRVLIPCSADARMTLTEGLMELGAHVDRIHIYNAEKPSSIDEKLIDDVEKADVITFTSSSTVTNFFDIVPDSSAIFASIGPVTTETLVKKGCTPAVTADEYTIEGLVKSLLEYYS